MIVFSIKVNIPGTQCCRGILLHLFDLKVQEMSLTTTELLIGVAIAVLLGGTLALIFWRQRKEAASSIKGQQETSQYALNLQVQAYERLILLTERIALPNLISRVNQPGISARDMQYMLTNTIRQEFEHNVTQQMYVSQQSWDAVKNLKEQNIHIINQVASFLPADASGNDLNKSLLDMLVQHPNSALHNVVSDVLNYEAKRIMNLPQ
jgi:hypothetical protein